MLHQSLEILAFWSSLVSAINMHGNRLQVALAWAARCETLPGLRRLSPPHLCFAAAGVRIPKVGRQARMVAAGPNLGNTLALGDTKPVNKWATLALSGVWRRIQLRPNRIRSSHDWIWRPPLSSARLPPFPFRCQHRRGASGPSGP
jgi:hypothetical protein